MVNLVIIMSTNFQQVHLKLVTEHWLYKILGLELKGKLLQSIFTIYAI